MAGIRIIKNRIDSGELGRVAFMESILQRARAGAYPADLALGQGPRPRGPPRSSRSTSSTC